MKKFKRFLSIVLAFVMVITLVLPVFADTYATSGTCGENVTWEFDVPTRTLTISGEGEMYWGYDSTYILLFIGVLISAAASARLNNVYKKYGLEDERNNNRERAYFLQMIMRDVQAVKFIMKSDYWNGKYIDVFGMSQGGFQCIAVTSLMRDYVTSAIAEVPWMCDIGGIEFGRMAGPGPKYEQALDYFN